MRKTLRPFYNPKTRKGAGHFCWCDASPTGAGWRPLNVRAVRVLLKTVRLNGTDHLHRGLRHLANAADAFRHLNVKAIHLLVQKLEDTRQAPLLTCARVCRLPSYDELLRALKAA